MHANTPPQTVGCHPAVCLYAVSALPVKILQTLTVVSHVLNRHTLTPTALMP
jgi:hypothetical protein